jgi:alkyl hydroperoxide reductase subunit AhpC
MKKTLYIILCVLFCTAVNLDARQLDSLQKNALSEKLEEYFSALRHEPVEVQKQECDFLIGSSTDSLVRQFVAMKIYEHYLTSPIMGVESVAIHVLDNWFFNSKIRMVNDIDLLNARIYADFNRQSLVGGKAQPLALTSLQGHKKELFTDSEKKGAYSVLYFYDTDCSGCRVESAMLKTLFNDKDYPVEFYAIYTGDNSEEWVKYVREKLEFKTEKTSVCHLWDPELTSDFQRKYGVIQTPRLFLVSPEGIILGRGLDSFALETMLEGVFTVPELNYGGKESLALFDNIFSSDSTVDDVDSVMGHIASSSLAKGDTTMFRQLSGDLLYYLASHRGEGIKEGLDNLIDGFILSRNDIWRSADDSLKIIGFAEMADELLSRSEPGKKVPGIKLDGVRLTKGQEKTGKFRTDALRGRRNIIIFHTDGCPVCRAEIDAARKLVDSQRGTRVLLVNVDEILSSAPHLSAALFDSFDLSSLPFIIETDRKGKVVRRYMALQ